MAFRKHAIIFLFIQCLVVAKSTVRLFEEIDVSGLMAELTATENCQNVPTLAIDKTQSLETEECIFVFIETNCNSDHIKILPGTYKRLSDVKQLPFHTFDRKIRSIRKCTSDYGGPSTKIKFILKNGEWEIQNLRSRIKVPSYAEFPIQFLNYGNCIVVECTSENLIYNQNMTVEGGKSPFTNAPQSQAMFPVRFEYVRPCDVKSSLIINSTVIQFKIIKPSNGYAEKKSDLAMGATTTFINDGWATVSQEYTATKTVTESSEVSLIKSASKMNNWNVQAGAQYEYTVGVPTVSSHAVKASLSTAYTREETHTTGETKTVYHEIKTEFSAKQKIEIEPCTKYQVDSFIRMTEGVPMDYTVTFEITGSQWSKPLSASEIKAKLGTLNYVKDKDNETVIACENGSMLLNFGIESIIDGKGEIIKECLENPDKVNPKLLLGKYPNTTKTD